MLWNESGVLSKMAPRGSFVDMVFRLVFFHQSMRGLTKFGGQMVELSDRDIFLYCDPKLLKLMHVMQSTDSSSYVFITNQTGADENTLLFEQANFNMLKIWTAQNDKSEEDSELQKLGYYDLDKTQLWPQK